MFSATANPNDKAPRRFAAAILASIAAHVGIYAWIALSGAPEFDFEFQLPAEVEFGLTESVDVQAATIAAATPNSTGGAGTNAPAAAPGASADGGTLDAGEPDAGEPDAGRRKKPRDAGPEDAGPDAEVADATITDAAPRDATAVATVDAGRADETRDAGSALATATTTSTTATMTDAMRLPAGAQLALRVDMTHIRNSPLAPDVRQFLGAIPDWQAILGDSGINPVDDLDHVLIASPNLQRSRMLMAASYAGDPARVREIVDHLGQVRGVPVRWRRQHGVQVAPWANRDETERVVAMIGPRHFSITRPEDLPRLLAVAVARQETQTRDRRRRNAPDLSGQPADALLSMEPGAALSLEAEGLQQFVRGDTRFIPNRVSLSVSETEDHKAAVLLKGWFSDSVSAEAAKDFWERMIRRYARDPWVALLNVGAPLQNATIEQADDEPLVIVRTELGPRELRLILGYVEGFFTRRRP